MKKIFFIFFFVSFFSCLAVDNSLAFHEYLSFVNTFNKYCDANKEDTAVKALVPGTTKKEIGIFKYNFNFYVPQVSIDDAKTNYSFLFKPFPPAEFDLIKSYSDTINKRFINKDGSVGSSNGAANTIYLLKDFGFYSNNSDEFLKIEKGKYCYKGYVLMSFFEYESPLASVAKGKMYMLSFATYALKYKLDNLDKAIGELEFKADADVAFEYVLEGYSKYTTFNGENQLDDRISACTLAGIFQDKVREYSCYATYVVAKRFVFPENEVPFTAADSNFFANFSPLIKAGLLTMQPFYDATVVWANDNKTKRESATPKIISENR